MLGKVSHWRWRVADSGVSDREVSSESGKRVLVRHPATRENSME